MILRRRHRERDDLERASRRGLQQKSRFADARIAADQHGRDGPGRRPARDRVRRSNGGAWWRFGAAAQPNKGHAAADRRLRGGPRRASSFLAMVFQSPQFSHRPAHLGVIAPQDWQTNGRRDLANGRQGRLAVGIDLAAGGVLHGADQQPPLAGRRVRPRTRGASMRLFLGGPVFSPVTRKAMLAAVMSCSRSATAHLSPLAGCGDRPSRSRRPRRPGRTCLPVLEASNTTPGRPLEEARPAPGPAVASGRSCSPSRAGLPCRRQN